MGRENKNAAIAAVHRKKILESAGRLFAEKGFEAATIEDISVASEYSRRTVYAYFRSKEDILHSLICEGLSELKSAAEEISSREMGFEERCRKIFDAMGIFYARYPAAAEIINGFKPCSEDTSEPSPAIREIFTLGEDINSCLGGFIRSGIQSGYVRSDTVPELTVYILWSEISAFYGLMQCKGKFICGQMSISEKELCDYGFKHIFGSIFA